MSERDGKEKAYEHWLLQAAGTGNRGCGSYWILPHSQQNSCSSNMRKLMGNAFHVMKK